MNDTLAALSDAVGEVNTGGAGLSVTVKDCVATGLTPFDTVIVNVEGVAEATVGGLVKSIWPATELSSATQLGAPVKLYWARVGVGAPVATTWKCPFWPARTEVLFALVIVGAATVSVSVKLCVALGLTPLATVIVNVTGDEEVTVGALVKSS